MLDDVLTKVYTLIDTPFTTEEIKNELLKIKDMLTDGTVLIIEWSEADIQYIAREELAYMGDTTIEKIIEEPLTKEQVREVIALIKARYDCSEGITWETIRCALDHIVLPDSESCIKGG